MKKLLLTGTCLALGLAAGTANAALSYWQPAGSQAANYTGDMSGTWESSLWSSVSTTISAVPFIEGTAAALSYRAGGGTPAFTVTMNSTHTVAGFFVTLGGSATNCTIAGPGTVILANANLNGASLNSTNFLTLAVKMAGSSTAGWCPQGSGQLYMNGTNTFSGNTYLGYSGGSFTGIVNFNNAGSFGAANIVLLSTSGGALVAEGTDPITIPNSIVNYHVNTYTVSNGVPNNFEGINIVGNTSGITFSGPVVCSGAGPGAGGGTYATNNRILPSYAQVSIGSGGATNDLVTFSGVVSGTNFFNKYGNGILALAGKNTLTYGLNVSNGTLRITSTGSVSNLQALNLSTNSTLDVTAYSTYTMASNTTFRVVNPDENIAGNIPPNILANTFDFGQAPIDITYTTADTANPALTVSQGSLHFNTNTITINNTNAQFVSGEYVELLVIGDGNSGVYTGTLPSTIAVYGMGLAPGCVAIPTWFGSTLYAVITTATATTTTTLSTPASIGYGTAPSITATVSPDPSASGGTVQFYLNGAPLGSAVPVTSGGVATYTTPSGLLAVSGATVTNNITAEYSGSPDAAYGSSVATAVVQAVTPGNLTVTANAQTTTYGTLPSGAIANYTISGLAPGDTVASVTVTTTGVQSTNTPVGGPYTGAITPTGLTAGTGSAFVAANYSITYVDGDWTINPKALTITPKATVKVYGSVLSLTGFTNNTLTTIANGQTSGVQVSLSTAGAPANAPIGSYALTSVAASEVAGKTNFDPNNYTITYGSGTLTVTNLAVVLTGTRAFDGTANADASILTVSNAVAGDDVTVASGSGTLSSSAVGTNAITSVGTLALGGITASNYTLVGATGAVIITSGSFSITSAALDSTKTNLVVCFDTTSGASYTVLTNTSLSNNGGWTDVGAPISPVTASGTNTCVTIPGVTTANPRTFVLIKKN